MNIFYVPFLLLTLSHSISGNENLNPIEASTTVSPQAVYQPQNPSRYVPSSFHYPDMYGSISPYEGYLYPSADYPLSSSTFNSMTQGAFQLLLKFFSKISLFLLGGMVLLLVGGLFTTAVCSFTPLCNITFNGFSNIDKETVRAFMTPEKLSTAAALVQDAIGKYQRLQRSRK
ncbi:hypothetical protein TcasGA2_TC031895 [Tribolium castaneum]|uniref:Uncharacterized protein n=1 Tax=Tribolium castaneum TaxID=7070 RepID=A0A139WA39_TRICA|nr:PREDICTED: uncharacterized protein LOC103312938 isoform X2 [Tribolium castaneum]KYB24770.1 hypothetical protein TcasGA2_TC031895 [Tribolium castaneum]|eukprot:XP_015839934.1 PREDICTED: uncharacterized protein LOC103312938 isoform X2 [Tribolium castaneum]